MTVRLRAGGSEADQRRRCPPACERCEVAQKFVARCSIWGGLDRLLCWHVIVRAPVQMPPVFCFVDATPLFEKENRSLPLALLVDRVDPRGLHRPGAVPTFSTYDYPVDTREIQGAEVFQ